MPRRANHRDRAKGSSADPYAGYDPLLEERMEAVLPLRSQRHSHHQQHGGRKSAGRRCKDVVKSRVASVYAGCGSPQSPAMMSCHHCVRGRSISSNSRRTAPAARHLVIRQRISRGRHRFSMRSKAVRTLSLLAVSPIQRSSSPPDPRIWMGSRRLESPGAGNCRRPSARVCRPAHRRLFRRSRLQGRTRLAHLGFPIAEVSPMARPSSPRSKVPAACSAAPPAPSSFSMRFRTPRVSTLLTSSPISRMSRSRKSVPIVFGCPGAEAWRAHQAEGIPRLPRWLHRRRTDLLCRSQRSCTRRTRRILFLRTPCLSVLGITFRFHRA